MYEGVTVFTASPDSSLPLLSCRSPPSTVLGVLPLSIRSLYSCSALALLVCLLAATLDSSAELSANRSDAEEAADDNPMAGAALGEGRLEE